MTEIHDGHKLLFSVIIRTKLPMLAKNLFNIATISLSELLTHIVERSNIKAIICTDDELTIIKLMSIILKDNELYSSMTLRNFIIDMQSAKLVYPANKFHTDDKYTILYLLKMHYQVALNTKYAIYPSVTRALTNILMSPTNKENNISHLMIVASVINGLYSSADYINMCIKDFMQHACGYNLLYYTPKIDAACFLQIFNILYGHYGQNLNNAAFYTTNTLYSALSNIFLNISWNNNREDKLSILGIMDTIRNTKYYDMSIEKFLNNVINKKANNPFDKPAKKLCM